MSSIPLVYSNRKVCARGGGQNRRFRSFSNVDPTTRKECTPLEVKGSFFIFNVS